MRHEEKQWSPLANTEPDSAHCPIHISLLVHVCNPVLVIAAVPMPERLVLTSAEGRYSMVMIIIACSPSQISLSTKVMMQTCLAHEV